MLKMHLEYQLNKSYPLQQHFWNPFLIMNLRLNQNLYQLVLCIDGQDLVLNFP